MNYYYLVFLIILTISGSFFYKTVNNIAGLFVTALGGVSILIYLYVNYFKDNSDNLVTMWPGETYLRESGAQCPNYWKASGQDVGKDEVECIYVGPNSMPENGKNCYDTIPGVNKQGTKIFSRATVKYPLQMDLGREMWMNNCKYTDGKRPPWVEYELN
jgi:hypothetical protein